MKLNQRNNALRTAAVLIALVPCTAFATGTGGATALPWEGPLNTVRDSLTGPVAIAIGTVAFFVAGGMLIFGSEIGDFAKRTIYAVLAASLMILGGTLIERLFGAGTLI
jgi:type IV secretion system protein VirB2